MSEPIKKLVIKKADAIDLRDPKELTKLLKQPATTIAAFLTGAFASGRQDVVLAGGRLVQAAIAGNLIGQLGVEIEDMIDKGKIKRNYAETKYGFKSLGDILKFIDSEAPDEDRFEAAKNLFFALNSPDTKESDEILMYKLFKISMELSATEILMLKTTWNFLKMHKAFSASAHEWIGTMMHEQGHHLRILVEQDEKSLIEKGLLSDRIHPDRSGIKNTDARLTDLGVKLCEYLSDYSDTKKDWVCDA